MRRETVYYGIIAVAILIGCVVGARTFSGPATVELPSPEVLQQQVTADAPVEVRVEAARNLIRLGDSGKTQVRQSLANYRQIPPEVVAPLLQATAKTRDHRSLPTVIELLEHPDPAVRGKAGVAVRKILGADFGFRANDPPDKRAAVIAHIKHDFEIAGPRIREFYGN